jgi:hypothetical protein
VTGPLGFIAVNALAGAGQKVTTDVIIDGKSVEESITDPNTIVAAGLGAVAAKLGGQVPKVPTYLASNGEKISFAMGPEAVVYGGKKFASNTADMLLSQQVESVFTFRTVAGGVVANVPTHNTVGCNGPFECARQFIFGDSGTPPPCTVNPNDQY